jgi:saccharopine dehydrogenase-like NADP-dependent oxidoreductase
MKNIAVIGLGKVGSLVATLLSEQFTVTGIDQSPPQGEIPFKTTTADIRDTASLEKILSNHDAVVSCLPYHLNLPIAHAAYKTGIHYFDLTEDVSTTETIRRMANTSKGVMVPQCGLAPGFIGIVGADLCKRFTKLRDVELRVGALPKYPNGLLGYSFTWSPAGVINEYINDAEVIHNGVRKMVPSLDGTKLINIEGQEFEAFTTSGGLGTLCETLEGKCDTLNYKTIRYPGHAPDALSLVRTHFERKPPARRGNFNSGQTTRARRRGVCVCCSRRMEGGSARPRRILQSVLSQND